MGNFIDIEKLKFKYYDFEVENSLGDSRWIIDGVDLQIQKGEFICLLGKNGSGKSTLAKHLNALYLPSEGTVKIAGMDTQNSDYVWDIRQKVGMIFQNPDNQIIGNTVAEDVAFGLENIGYRADGIRDKVYEVLKLLSMYDLRDKSPEMLSGGQKQRVAIAGVVAMEPECIVLDEPTAMLDPKGRKDVMELLLKLNKEKNITIILVTHYMDEVVLSDRVIVMDKGRIGYDTTPVKLFSQIERIKELGLDVPDITLLAHELKEAGVALRTDIIDIDEMVMELCRLI